MPKRVRISNCSLNSYGTRVLTAGMNVEQYQRNPVLLYMHERGNVIGCVRGLKVEGDDVTGELVFDEATELSKRCRKQYEFGSLKMVSVGIDILEMSEDSGTLVQGQTSPTITKSKLFEVSLVDIGANDDAIVMKRDGIQIKLGKDGENCLPIINNNTKTMEQKMIALQLGLPETATEAEITAKLGTLKAAEGKVDALQKEKEALALAAITQTVETAIEEKRIGEDRKEQFVKLGKSVGVEELKKTFEAMSPQMKLSQVLGHSGNSPRGVEGGKAAYKKLSEVPEEEMESLRDKNPEMYRKLYKAEYGMECEL